MCFIFRSLLLQHHSSKATILWRSAFFTVQLSHPYMTIGKTIALTRWTLVGKVMSLLFNMLSSLVITFLPRSKHLLISWLESPSASQGQRPRVPGCIGTGEAERSYPTTEVSGGGRDQLPHTRGQDGGQDELLHVQGQEGWP